MTGLAALAVALLGSLTVPAPAPAPAHRRVHATITPARPQLVLGVDQEMLLTVDVHDNDGGVVFSPERAMASIGAIASVTPSSPDRFTARYIAPASRFPQVTMIVVDLVGAGLRLRATARLPLHGAAEMPFRTSANASVSVRVGDRTFGPVRADAQGNVAIPIVVPPGIHDGLARATDVNGNARETTVDLQPVPFNQLMIVAAPRFEVGSFAEVSTFAVTARGEPMTSGSTTLRTSQGMVHPLGEGAPGEERFLVEAPRRVGDGSLRLFATTIGVAPNPIVVLERHAEIVVPLIAAQPNRLSLSPTTNHLIIGEGLAATVTIAAHDRHDNPASCAGARLTVERRPVDLIPDGGGCGRIVVPAPTRASRAGTIEIEAVLGSLKARTSIRVTPPPAVRLAASVSAREVVGDGRQSVDVRVDAFDHAGRLAGVPNLRWQAAGGRLGPVRALQDGIYVTQFTPNPTRTPRAEVLVVKGDPLLSATTLLRVEPQRSRLSVAARVGLFTNFGSMAGPMAAIEALQGLPGRAAAWAAGLVVSYVHNDLTTTAGGTVGLPDTHVEIDQVPCLAITQYRLPIRLGANIAVGGGAGISLAKTNIRSRTDAWPAARGNAHALAAELRTDAAFPLAPGELVMGAHYLWIDLGRTSQGDQIDGNTVGFVGDIGFRMAW